MSIIVKPKFYFNSSRILLEIQDSKLKYLESLFIIDTSSIDRIASCYQKTNNYLLSFKNLSDPNDCIYSIDYDALPINAKSELIELMKFNENITFNNEEKCICISEEDFLIEIALDRNFMSLAEHLSKFQSFNNQILIIEEDIISLTIKKNKTLVHSYFNQFEPFIIDTNIIINVLEYWRSFLKFLTSTDLDVLNSFKYQSLLFNM